MLSILVQYRSTGTGTPNMHKVTNHLVYCLPPRKLKSGTASLEVFLSFTVLGVWKHLARLVTILCSSDGKAVTRKASCHVSSTNGQF